VTYQEIIDYANIVLDDYRTPFMDDVRNAGLLYDAIMEFVKQSYDQGELNERRREDLLALVRPLSPPAGVTINLDAITDFMFMFNLAGTFTDPCNDKATIYRPIRPVKLDKINTILDDTFEKPNDYYPVYVQYKGATNLLQIFSTTAPVGYSMKYIALPNQPNPATLASTSPELGVQTHLEIGKIFARKVMETTDDFNRYPLEQNEIQLSRN